VTDALAVESDTFTNLVLDALDDMKALDPVH